VPSTTSDIGAATVSPEGSAPVRNREMMSSMPQRPMPSAGSLVMFGAFVAPVP